LDAIQVHKVRGFIVEWFRLAPTPGGRGKFSRPGCTGSKINRGAGESVCNQHINKCPDVLADVMRHAFSMPAHLLNDGIHGMLSVKELPHEDAGGAQAKTMTGIRVEEHSPIVKLLPEQDVRVD
jgi:hypothetical protein